MSTTSAILIGVMLVTSFAVVLPAVADPAQACGFNGEEHVGPVEVGMKCTRPYVEIHPEDAPEPPG